MAKRPLKVFRTSIGFQDAYVAASSRKAALEAWGASKDLFAAGLAELVTDPALTKAALAKPGVVIRASRGTTAQHLAAAAKMKKPARPKDVPPPDDAPPRPRKAQPRPSRAKLDKAESALDRQERDYAARLAQIDAKIDALRTERDSIRRERDDILRTLEDRRDRAEEEYRSALDAWEG